MKKALSLYFQNELHFKILRNNVFYSHKVNLKEQERNKTIILQIIDKITQGRIFKQYFHRLCFKNFPTMLTLTDTDADSDTEEFEDDNDVFPVMDIDM